MRTHTWGQRLAALAFLTVAAAAPAWAQGEPKVATPGGPLVLEPVQSGFVVAPDVKVTDFDGDLGTLVGGYAGWLHDRALFVGGAGYWLANGRRDQELAYGGLLVGWTVNGGGRVAFGARGLVGAGQATLSDDITFARRNLQAPGRSSRPGGASTGGAGTTGFRYWYDRQFLIFEPQGNVLVKLANGVRLDIGAGYRLIGSEHDFDDRLRGATGSIALRFGGK